MRNYRFITYRKRGRRLDLAIYTEDYSKMSLFVCIVDTSRHINQDQMDKINTSFARIIAELKQVQEKLKTCELKIAVMEFSQKAKWKTLPTSIQKYKIESFVPTNSEVSFDNVLKEMDIAFTRKNFFDYKGKIAYPQVLLITSGIDDNDNGSEGYKSKLYENGWFGHSYRYTLLTNNNKFEFKQTIAPRIKAFTGKDETLIDSIENVEYIIDSIKKFYECIQRYESRIDPMDYNKKAVMQEESSFETSEIFGHIDDGLMW